jgi:hypothetical protein
VKLNPPEHLPLICDSPLYTISQQLGEPGRVNMEVQELWVHEGCIVTRPLGEQGVICSDRVLLQQHNYVKIASSKSSITVQWYMSSANWASLFFAMKWITNFNGPFKLVFFNAGWFEETYDTTEQTKRRIDQLVGKSDVHLSSKVFTRDFLGSISPVAWELVQLLKQGGPDEGKAVICEVDVAREKVEVQHIGKGSVLAGIWGQAPMTYPCQTGHSYDKIVSKAYYRAVNENRPIYDQVLASMVTPNGNVQWISYQRVIFPTLRKSATSRLVAVNCALAPVDIQVF